MNIIHDCLFIGYLLLISTIKAIKDPVKQQQEPILKIQVPKFDIVPNTKHPTALIEGKYIIDPVRKKIPPRSINTDIIFALKFSFLLLFSFYFLSSSSSKFSSTSTSSDFLFLNLVIISIIAAIVRKEVAITKNIIDYK